MNLLNTIFAPQESVNDQFVSLISVYVKSGDFVESDTLLAELETSKAVVEVRSEVKGYVKVFVKENTDINIGDKMFEFFDASIIAENSDIKVEDEAELTVLNADINTIFSNKAEEFAKANNIKPEQFKNKKFITTKDFNSTTDNFPVEIQNEKKQEINLTTVNNRIKPISKIKKKEFEYLHSINSSDVISKLSVSIKLNYINILTRVQNFITSTPLPTIIQEVSKLLIKYPNLNSYHLNGNQVFYERINVGFAIDNGEFGLKVASVFDSDKLNLLEIENEITELNLKYLENKLNVAELTSSTFTITDLFSTDVITFNPLVNYNNSCILGVSSVNKGEFILDLSFDHRISSGKEIASFLSDLKFRLEARFFNQIDTSDEVECCRCYRKTSEDFEGEVFFTKIINSKFNGYICSNCLNGW
jgi:pyruvate/2-oxoglutarate dehydrogenase complex dihydrolipoamide acyltransferase (E2) component